MAVNGNKFSDTLNLGCEEWFEYLCSPCARDGKSLPAVKYCVECEENLCSSCFTHHNRFPVMKVHQITDNLSSRTRQSPQLPTERCDRHGGKLVDVYCPTHDVVGCSTCINVEHRKRGEAITIEVDSCACVSSDVIDCSAGRSSARKTKGLSSCHGIRYIPDMTQDLQLSEEVVDLEAKLKRLLARLDQMKQDKQNHFKLLEQEKDKLVKEIQALRKRINDKLDEMEKIIVSEVDTKIRAQMRDVSKETDVIGYERMALEKREMSIENAKNSNKTELFIQMKMGQANIRKSERSSELFQTSLPTINMKILPDDNVHRLLESKSTALGIIALILMPKCTKHDSDVNVRLTSDEKTCNNTGICVTSEGDIYLADGPNKRIKKLDQSYAVTEILAFPGFSSDICEIDNTRLAVTLPDQKKVQFVSRNPLTLRDSFTVGDRCRGIDYNNGQLYVCCGGCRDIGEGLGRIEVYSVGGDLLRSYYQGATWPYCVRVSERGDLIISNHGSISLVTLRMADNSVSDIQIKELREPRSMCRVGDSQLCVAGYTSNNIMLISEDGEHQQELLTQKDRILKPRAVCFDRSRASLVVSLFNSDTIKIFKVKNA